MIHIYKAAGIIVQDRKLLLTRAHNKPFFISPGGKIEPGETAEQAVIRELLEELSITVDKADLEFFGEYSASAATDDDNTVHIKVFMIKKWQGVIAPSAEVEELLWATHGLPKDIVVGSIFGGKVLPKLHRLGLVD